MIEELATQIAIEAAPKYEKKQRMEGAQYVYSYHITIINQSAYTVKLQRRYWLIADGLDDEREVEGAGVIGQMPILKPGKKFEYESWCPLICEYGSMKGFFTFEELTTRSIFLVNVPQMVLVPDFVLN